MTHLVQTINASSALGESIITVDRNHYWQTFAATVNKHHTLTTGTSYTSRSKRASVDAIGSVG